MSKSEERYIEKCCYKENWINYKAATHAEMDLGDNDDIDLVINVKVHTVLHVEKMKDKNLVLHVIIAIARCHLPYMKACDLYPQIIN